MAYIGLIINVVKFSVLFILLIKLALDYKKYRYTPILYILGSISLILLTEVQLASIIKADSDVASVSNFVGTLESTIYSLLLFLLFFDSFVHETVLNKRNVFFMIVASFIEGGIIVLMAQLNIIFETGTQDADLTDVEIVAFVLFGLFAVTGMILIILLARAALKSVNQLRKNVKDEELRKPINSVYYGMILMILSKFIPLFLPNRPIPIDAIFETIFMILGTILLLRGLSIGGLFIFQGENLLKLMIIDDSGLPKYSYTFLNFASALNRTLQQEENSEILFSGALTSISVLLNEFTGHNQKVNELSLQGQKIMIESIKNHSIVLFVNRSTIFYRKALKRFSEKIEDTLNSVQRGSVLSTDQIKYANDLIETSFGATMR